MKICQIVITKVEEPVDEPRGEVFKISIFDRKMCVDSFHHGHESDVVDLVRLYLEDLEAL